MKTTLIAIALATAGLSAAPMLSHAADANGPGGGLFINGNIGQSSLSKGAYDDNDTAYDANIGYRWALNPNVALGIEGGYANLGKFDPSSNFNSQGLGRASVKGWTLGVNGHFNITPEWYLSGRAGLFRAYVKGAYLDAAATPVYVDDTSSKYYAGAGVGYDFSNNLSIGVNYDYYKADKAGLKFDPSVVSVSAEVRF